MGNELIELMKFISNKNIFFCIWSNFSLTQSQPILVLLSLNPHNYTVFLLSVAVKFFGVYKIEAFLS